MVSMIDIHAHILPGLDDGARTLRESLKMCLIAYRDGTRTIVATPHTLNGVYQNDRSTILAKVRELNRALIKFGLQNPHYGMRILASKTQNPQSTIRNSKLQDRNPKFEIRILPGADVHFSDVTLCQLDAGKVTTLGDGGKSLLIEFPSQGIPYGAEDVLFQMIARGFIPIISHPERNLEIGQSPRRYSEMIRMGCLGQITAMSLTGGFGPVVRRAVRELLVRGLVHVIASDAHPADGRPPVLSPAVQAAARIVGQKEALKMVTEYPQAILDGRRPDVRTHDAVGADYR
jgi:protein-tyrosine phosphatase